MPKNLKAFGGQAQYSWFMLDEGGSQFGVWSLEFGVWSLQFGVWSLEFGVYSLEFGVQGLCPFSLNPRLYWPGLTGHHYNPGVCCSDRTWPVSCRHWGRPQSSALAAKKKYNTAWQVYPLPSALADGYKAVLISEGL